MLKIDNEIWKDIVDFEGLYQVSNLGRIKSLDRIVQYSNGGERLHKGQILKHRLDKGGYCRIKLCKNGIGYSCLVHRLVAQAFIPNHNNLPQINHKDEDKLNNKVENLEWCDAKYNINYGTHNERNAKSRINHPMRSKKVIQTDINSGETIAIYPSLCEAQRQGYSTSAIWACCRGKTKTHKGYHWAYYN